MEPLPKRAVSNQAKLQKRTRIMQEARTLFKDHPFQKINVNTIAQKSGVAKGTVFVYFKTKEDIFLAILQSEFEQLFNDLYLNLESINDSCTPSELAVKFTDVFAANTLLLRLVSILTTQIEENIPVETTLAFKKQLYDWQEAAGREIEQVLSFIPEGTGGDFLNQLYSIAIGSHQVSHPAEAIREILEQADFRHFFVEFREVNQSILENYLRGIMTQQ